MLEDDRDVVRNLWSKFRDFWSSFDRVSAFFFGVQNSSVGLSDVTSEYPTPESRNAFSECPTSHRSVRLHSRDPLSDCPTPGQSLRPPSPETPCRILRPCVRLSDPKAIQSVPFDFHFAFECSKSLLGLAYSSLVRVILVFELRCVGIEFGHRPKVRIVEF